MTRTRAQLHHDERASRIWESKVKGRNICTPRLIAHGFLTDSAASPIFELSEGEDFSHRTVVGVTILVGDSIDPAQSMLFHDKDLALDYLVELANA